MNKTAQTRLLIGIPCLDSIKKDTVTSLFAATSRLEVESQLLIYTASLIHDSRNKIAKMAIEKGFTHVMMIDQDIAFETEGINKLLAHDKDIIAGLYFRKTPPHQPTIAQTVDGKLTIPEVFPKKKLFEVTSVGTGFMMVKTEVYKNLKYPYYFYRYHNKNKTYVGEDVYFCLKAREKNYKVWVDPTIELAHVGDYAFELKDYEAYQDVKPVQFESDLDQLWQGEV